MYAAHRTDIVDCNSEAMSEDAASLDIHSGVNIEPICRAFLAKRIIAIQHAHAVHANSQAAQRAMSERVSILASTRSTMKSKEARATSSNTVEGETVGVASSSSSSSGSPWVDFNLPLFRSNSMKHVEYYAVGHDSPRSIFHGKDTHHTHCHTTC